MKATWLTSIAAAALFLLFPHAALAQTTVYYYPPSVQYVDPGAVSYAMPYTSYYVPPYVNYNPGVRVYGPGQYWSYSPFYYAPSAVYPNGYSYYPGYTTYYRTWRTWR